ncbi:RNA-directed DNA polymerase [Amycolatopsis sp. OK19-0408]|uniref:RNA-directed DNA polymerase n=1 Tax=Amycolatopsis iheyensis TaxID=2945988 RepID=A0A9X2SIS2_9PSEU|nr:RNA-directed DNA polymerase [Amycolatopsis iheyensis]
MPASWTESGWLIQDARIEGSGYLQHRAPDIETVPDFERALLQLELTDFIEIWFPDILRFQDKLSDRGKLLENVREKFDAGIIDPVVEIEIPKAEFFARTGHLLTLEDRIAYHAVVGTFAEKLDDTLMGVVFSSRYNSQEKNRQTEKLTRLARKENTLLRKGVRQWKKWTKYVRASARAGNDWLVKTDLSSYFDCIRHEILLGELSMIGVSKDIRCALGAYLSAWSNAPGQGLPQGPDVSRILGNFYLAPVDAAMIREGFKYSRYMDDVRIVGQTRDELTRAMRRFGAECRQRGLIVSSVKTVVLHGDAARKVDLDSEREIAQYLLDTRQGSRAVRLLRKILEDSLAEKGRVDARGARFSLWRLAFLRDENVCKLVLDNLEVLAPVASIVGDYLSGYIDKGYVRDGLTEYLSNRDVYRDDYLVAYLFAAMLEFSGDMPKLWVDSARNLTKDRHKPDYLRGVAANVLALGGLPEDLAWLRNEARRETGTGLQRAYATGLRRVGHLDDSTCSVLTSRSIGMAQAVEYLKSAARLPSLVRPYTTVPIKRSS